MTEIDTPLISVIVPVYNVENYIDKCLESIVNQDYKNLEIILVDDESSDTAGEKCDTWSEKDARIKVIHKVKNEGLFRARISGLELMSGSYFTLVDSDDYIKTDFISKLLGLGLKSAADIVIENTFTTVDNHGAEGDVVEMPKLHTPVKVFDGFMNNISKENWGWCVWAKIYRSSIYHESREHLAPINMKINAAEDILFSTVFASFAKKTVYIDDYTGYYYRQNDTSLTRLSSNEASISRLVSITDALFEMERFLKAIRPKEDYNRKFHKLKEHLLSNYVWALHNDYMKIMSNFKIQNSDLRANNVRINADNSKLKQQNNEILTSYTYKTGNLIAAPYRKLRRMLR